MSARIEIDYEKVYPNYASISRFNRNDNRFVTDKIYWPYNILSESSYISKSGAVNRIINIQFINKNMYNFNTTKTISISCINKMNADDPYIPTFCGIGCIGNAYTTINGAMTPEYVKWRSMLTRCYNPNHVEYHIYGKTFVCREWLCYEYFCNSLPSVYGYNDWVNDGFIGYDMDKDYLQPNSPVKIYSPETCMLIKAEYNSMRNINAVNNIISLEDTKYLDKQRLYTIIKGGSEDG